MFEEEGVTVQWNTQSCGREAADCVDASEFGSAGSMGMLDVHGEGIRPVAGQGSANGSGEDATSLSSRCIASSELMG